MSNKNPFQLAVLKIQAWPTVGPRFVKIYNGKDEVKESDSEDAPVSIQVHGFGDVRGANLDDACARMKHLVETGLTENWVDPRSVPAAAPAPSTPGLTQADLDAAVAAAVAKALAAQK